MGRDVRRAAFGRWQTLRGPRRIAANRSGKARSMTTAVIIAPSLDLIPAPLFAPTAKVARRVAKCLAAQINNDHTRRANVNGTKRFAAWCNERGLRQPAGVQPVHVAAFVKHLERELSTPPVK